MGSVNGETAGEHQEDVTALSGAVPAKRTKAKSTLNKRGDHKRVIAALGGTAPSAIKLIVVFAVRQHGYPIDKLPADDCLDMTRRVLSGKLDRVTVEDFAAWLALPETQRAIREEVKKPPTPRP